MSHSLLYTLLLYIIPTSSSLIISPSSLSSSSSSLSLSLSLILWSFFSFFLILFGEMRLSEVVIVVWLLLWACVGSNTVARKSGCGSNLFEGAKKKNRSEELQNNDSNNNAKKFILKNKNNNTTTTPSSETDEKRVVPTGPNPLHNRR
ncbi:hypothetical protein PIB30_008184 [Stylosanthes scabra]|uniref:Uncharacterized protein n=1 Tax=Stylosanthes scabra TaxID=79078 RepID=A0ABU6Z6R6_9FABA|nr:hypothetical protein [Stylosanthes scabra]